MDWSKFNFSGTLPKSAGDYLQEIKKSFEETQNVLKMDIEATDGYIDLEPPKIAALYFLFVRSPKLGNYRMKILSVAEYADDGRFPVDIVSHFDNDKKFSKVNEADFNDVIQSILTLQIVIKKIEYLHSKSAG